MCDVVRRRLTPSARRAQTTPRPRPTGGHVRNGRSASIASQRASTRDGVTPLESTLVTLAALLVAIVAATMAGGLVGRRIRVGRERRASRSAGVHQEPGGSSPAPSAAAVPGAAVAGAVSPPSAAGPTAAPDRSAARGLTIHGMAASEGQAGSAGEVLGHSEFARRLAGAPPSVVTRRPSPLSPALEARHGQPIFGGPARLRDDPLPGSGVSTVVTAATGSPPTLAGPASVRPTRRGDRRPALLALAGIGGALVLTLGIAFGWLRPAPSGQVLEASATPAASPPAASAGSPGPATATPTGSAGGSQQPSSDGSGTTPTSPGQTAVDRGHVPGGGTAATPTPRSGVGAPTPGGTPTLGASVTPTPGLSASLGPTAPPSPGATPTPGSTATASPRPTATPAATPTPTSAPTPTPAPSPTSPAPPTPVPTSTLKAPAVAFSFTVNGLAAKFTNKTKGAESWTWSFGDGASSTARNPSHTYASAGIYTVTLAATGTNGATASATHPVSTGG